MFARIPKFRWWLSIASTYITVLLVIGVICIPFTLTHVIKTNPFSSNIAKTKFNEEEDPTLILQFSDIHVNHMKDKNNEIFRKSVEFGNQIHPDLFLFTGDLVDDLPQLKHPKYPTQQPKDWEIYRNITESISADELFEIAGNHDEYAVYSFDSKSHNFANSIKRNFSNIDEFQLYNKTISADGYKIHIIGANPFVFPSAHAPYVYWPRPTKELLDKIEKFLENVPESDEVIFTTHYPLKTYLGYTKSSSGKTFVDIISSGKVHYYLSGHLHPDHPRFLHFTNILEVVAVDLTYHNGFGGITFDNRRFVYHNINATNPKKSFVTYPVPTEQLTNHQIFNEPGIPLRVISYQSEAPTITISGDATGQMNCEKRKKGFYLCMFENDLQEGTHTITFGGDMNETVEFTIANKSSLYRENDYRIWIDYYEQYTFQFIVLFVVLLFIFFPLPQSQFSQTIISHLRGQESVITIQTYIILLLFGGFIYLRFRIQRLPIWIKTLLMIALFYPFVLPIALMEIEGHLGFIWMWGYFCGGKNYYSPWSQFDFVFYYITILLPVALLAASISLSYPYTIQSFIPVFVDIVTAVAGIVADVLVMRRFIYESVGFVFAPLSFVFVFIPIILYASLIIWRIFMALKNEQAGISTTKESMFLST